MNAPRALVVGAMVSEARRYRACPHQAGIETAACVAVAVALHCGGGAERGATPTARAHGLLIRLIATHGAIGFVALAAAHRSGRAVVRWNGAAGTVTLHELVLPMDGRCSATAALVSRTPLEASAVHRVAAV